MSETRYTALVALLGSLIVGWAGTFLPSGLSFGESCAASGLGFLMGALIFGSR